MTTAEASLRESSLREDRLEAVATMGCPFCRAKPGKHCTIMRGSSRGFAAENPHGCRLQEMYKRRFAASGGLP